MTKINLQCTHPKYAIYDGVNKSGKKHISFLRYKTYDGIKELEHSGKEQFQLIEEGKVKNYKKEDLVLIPCGQCIACRMRYSYQWANRLLCELQMHDPKTCFFVTLTYDNDHIDLCHKAKDKDGKEIDNLWSLEKEHLQLFMKRLRRRINLKYVTLDGEIISAHEANPECEYILYQKGKRKGQPKEFYLTTDNIRFFASGEYGSKNHRCHFHLILFNLKLPDDDLHFLKKSKLGYDYKTSDIIAECWPYGFNVVAPVTWESCSYTARYMLKKMKGIDNYVYSDFGIEAPFSQASRKPGIGKRYYENLDDFGKISYLNIGTDSGLRKFAPPQYFERLFEKEFPEEAEIRKARRKKFAESAQAIELSNTDKDRESYLRDCEEILEKKDKILYNYRDL